MPQTAINSLTTQGMLAEHVQPDNFTPAFHILLDYVIDGIYNIKGRSTLHVLVAYYTNKHVTFNKGQCIGHMEPSIDHMPQTSINSLITKKIIDEPVWPNTFIPLLHTLPGDVRKSLNQLLGTFKSQFAQDETSIGTTHLTKLQIDRDHSEHVLQRPYLIAMKHYGWVKDEVNKLLNVQVICSSHFSLSAPIIVVPKADGGKFLVIDYRALNKVTWKFMWSMPKVEDIFSQLNGAKYFSTLNLHAGYHHIHLNEDSIPKTALHSFWKPWISEGSLWIGTSTGIFPRTDE